MLQLLLHLMAKIDLWPHNKQYYEGTFRYERRCRPLLMLETLNIGCGFNYLFMSDENYPLFECLNGMAFSFKQRKITVVRIADITWL